MKSHCFLIFGGDQRQRYLFESLKSQGYAVNGLFFQDEESEPNPLEVIQNADVLIFPIPTSKDGAHLSTPNNREKIKIKELFPYIKEESILFIGGQIPLFQECPAKQVYDLLEDETLTLKNAMATAEAALAILIHETKQTLFQSRVLVLGYGRIAAILSEYLDHLHAEVSICARSESARTKALLHGLTPFDFQQLEKALPNFDIVINTIPAMVLSKKELQHMKPTTFLCDLASRPGGIDFKAAEKLGLKAVHSLSLPGAFSPQSAAQFIEKSILKALENCL